MKNRFTLFILLLAHSVAAQWQPGHKKADGAMISAGGGVMQMQPSYLKDSAFLGNGASVYGDLFIPLLKTRKSMSIGLQTAISWSRLSAGGALTFAQQNYQLLDGTIRPAPGGIPHGKQINISVGPQLHWEIGRLFLAPGIRVGHTSLSRNGISISDSISANGAAARKYFVRLYETDEIKSSGFSIMPQLKAGVRIGEHLSFWAGAEYMSGPEVNTVTRRWQPLGDPAEGAYNFGQYVEGQAITRSHSSRLQALALQAGIAYQFAGRRSPASAVKPATTAIPSSLQATDTGTSKNRQRASAPVIISPAEHATVSAHNGLLFFHYIPSDFPQSKMKLVIWKITEGRKSKVFEETYLNGWNGTVKEQSLQPDKSGISRYEAQLTASYHPGAGAKGTSRAAFTAASIPVYDNNGHSNITAFNIQNNCTVDHIFALDSTKCIGGDTIRVYGHANILPNTAGVTTATITFDPVFIETTTNTPVTPVNFQPGNSITVTSGNTTFSFDIVGDMCDKQLRVFYDFSYQCPTLQVPAHIPCADTISLPCCICSYCDDPENMNIITGHQSMDLSQSDVVAITQAFNINPKNITRITAQIVHISESNIDPACMSCAKDEASVYRFVGSNQAAWNGGSAINSSPLPAKVIEWSSNNKGDLSLNMHVALPGLAALDCCQRDIRICIRYTFTDRDCKTCERLVCYEGTQTPKP